MENYMIVFLVLLVFVFISRTIYEKAIKKLEIDKKAALIDLFSTSRMYILGIMIGIVILFFLCLQFHWVDSWIAYIVYIVVIFGFLISTSYFSYKKLRENEYPESFIRSYILSTALRFLGLVIFFALLKY